MTAIRELIFEAIVDTLTAAQVAPEIERMPSGDPIAYPAVEIVDLGDVPATGEAGTDRWVMTFAVTGMVQADTGAEAHAAMNALDTAVIEALFVEPVLGGLATEITADRLQPGIVERAERRQLYFERTFNLYYATRRGMPQVID
ncbi:MAG TPA: hypothetical protein VMQ93_16235 [Novosphingobium sp.]|nr:hypothetical protein [Novosphingobium sp.]